MLLYFCCLLARFNYVIDILLWIGVIIFAIIVFNEVSTGNFEKKERGLRIKRLPFSAVQL